ncbi:MHYT domain-containing protein [Glycomyces xiaoerkulensis]|uniref:MHYT domain-containing protein n=1 Tax=Glycomyces xiaoerkulensis TaxID=2038139 RepID=UPI0018E487FF|nr:MHYT domain-containing protein [Glycomyces xiaoerkulensis]
MIEHFSHGYITLLVAFGVSMTGSAVGLLLTRRARQSDRPGRRVPWLLGAAFAIGGVGIWVMHFVAMLGFAVDGATVRYDPLLTALSAVIAVAVVGCGLLIIGLGRYNALKLVSASLLTGLGVAAMHYTGMAALTANIELHHDPAYVWSAIGIAIAASGTALWLAWRLDRAASIWLASGVMALAVNAMHYTAMLGVRTGAASGGPVIGVESWHLIFPMATLTVFVMLILIYVVATEPPLREPGMNRAG